MPLNEKPGMDVEEDVHVCLKCKATIFGLDNYISHRKAACSKPLIQQDDNPDNPTTDDELPNEKINQDQNITSRSSHNTDNTPTSTNETCVSKQNNTSSSNNNEGNQIIVSDTSFQDIKNIVSNHNNDINLTNDSNIESEKNHTSKFVCKVNSTQAPNECFLDDYNSSLSESVQQNPYSVIRSPPKYKLVDDNRKQTSREHFTRFSDPILHQDHESSLFRGFETVLFSKETSSTFDLERYTNYDFYNLPPPATQEPILSTETELDSIKDKVTLEISSTPSHIFRTVMSTSPRGDSDTIQITPSNGNEICNLSPSVQTVLPSCLIEDNKKRTNNECYTTVQNNTEENFSIEQKDESNSRIIEIKQDDFLSSLELRSSGKRINNVFEEDYDDYDEPDLPRNYTGGKWKPGSIPPSHVRGKWRPECLSPSFISDKPKGFEIPSSNASGKWKSEVQPSTSIGGKWKPTSPRISESGIDNDTQDVLEDEIDKQNNENSVKDHESISISCHNECINQHSRVSDPPPTHTKGKWLPGKNMQNLIKSGSQVDYYCSSCNRTLKGKESYERHLRSEFHFVNENKSQSINKLKNTFEKNSNLFNTTRPARKKKIQAKSFLKQTILKLKRKRSDIIQPIEKSSINQKNEKDKTTFNQSDTVAENILIVPDDDEEPAPRVPKIECPICCLSFPLINAVRHFASLAHIHNELQYQINRNKIVDVKYNRLILKNIKGIVSTSYFTCNLCNFYCNLHSDLIRHFNNHNCEAEMNEVTTLFTCSACKEEGPIKLKELKRHLNTTHHLDSIRDEILQAKKIEISYQNGILCPLCNKFFKFRHAYKIHRNMSHNDLEFHLPEQRKYKCSQCSFSANKEFKIRIHLLEEHNKKASGSYHCFVCGLIFNSNQEAEKHRQSSSHKTTRKKLKGLSVEEICNLCYTKHKDLNSLKDHMNREHGSLLTPCVYCGKTFPIRSHLAAHQKICTREIDPTLSYSENTNSCQLCSFSNPVLAYVLMHTTIAHGVQDSSRKYQCHICKVSLD